MTSRARSLNSVIVKDSTASMLSSSCVRLIYCSSTKDGKHHITFRMKSIKHIKFGNSVKTKTCMAALDMNQNGLARREVASDEGCYRLSQSRIGLIVRGRIGHLVERRAREDLDDWRIASRS